MSTQSKKLAGGLVAMALRPFIGDASTDLAKMISRGPTDHAQRLMLVMSESQDRGWRALEIGLRGSSWWDRAANMVIGRGDDVALQKQIGTFLQDLESRQTDSNLVTSGFRQNCLDELKLARSQGLIPGPKVPADRFPDEIRIFPAGATTTQIRDAEEGALAQVSLALAERGYSDLAKYIALAPSGEIPLLVLAVQYFFRRAIETDPGLSHLMEVQRLDKIDNRLNKALEGLDNGFRALGTRLDTIFGELSNQVSRVQTSVDNVQNTLTTFQLEETRRQDAAEKDRQIMLDTLRTMSEQIAKLSGGTGASTMPVIVDEPKGLRDGKLKPRLGVFPMPVSVDDKSAVEKIRQEARLALAKCKASINPEERRQAAVLEEVTQRFDAVQKRAFPYLKAPSAAEKSGIITQLTPPTSGLFGRSTQSLPRNRPLVDGPGQFSMSVYRGSRLCPSIMFNLVPEGGGVSILLRSNENGLVESPEMIAGSYKLSSPEQPRRIVVVRLRPGKNVLQDWDMANGG